MISSNSWEGTGKKTTQNEQHDEQVANKRMDFACESTDFASWRPILCHNTGEGLLNIFVIIIPGQTWLALRAFIARYLNDVYSWDESLRQRIALEYKILNILNVISDYVMMFGRCSVWLCLVHAVMSCCAHWYCLLLGTKQIVSRVKLRAHRHGTSSVWSRRLFISLLIFWCEIYWLQLVFPGCPDASRLFTFLMRIFRWKSYFGAKFHR